MLLISGQTHCGGNLPTSCPTDLVSSGCLVHRYLFISAAGYNYRGMGVNVDSELVLGSCLPHALRFFLPHFFSRAYLIELDEFVMPSHQILSRVCNVHCQYFVFALLFLVQRHEIV